VPPNRFAATRCGAIAGENSAFYCPADDTIYVGQQFAADLYNGVLRGLPGESAGERAAGDFAVAYVIAHEYAHNVQEELGVYDGRQGEQARPFELQADCLSGTWANSVFEQGLLESGDIEEALSTALAIGDFEVGSEQHHGTPEERRDALQLGFERGNPSDCARFVPQV
jgi:predicted metalloprotease